MSDNTNNDDLTVLHFIQQQQHSPMINTNRVLFHSPSSSSSSTTPFKQAQPHAEFDFLTKSTAQTDTKRHVTFSPLTKLDTSPSTTSPIIAPSTSTSTSTSTTNTSRKAADESPFLTVSSPSYYHSPTNNIGVDALQHLLHHNHESSAYIDGDVDSDDEHVTNKRKMFEMRLQLEQLREENETLRHSVTLLHHQVQQMESRLNQIEKRVEKREEEEGGGKENVKSLSSSSSSSSTLSMSGNHHHHHHQKEYVVYASNSSSNSEDSSSNSSDDEIDFLLQNICQHFYKHLLARTGLRIERLNGNVYQIGQYKVRLTIQQQQQQQQTSNLYVQLGGDQTIPIQELLDRLLSTYCV